MAHYSGQSLYVEFTGVNVSADYRTLDVSGETAIDDTTAGADTAESHIVLTTSATFDYSVLEDNAAGTAVIRALYNGAQGTLTFGPQGTAAGKPKYSCLATVTSVGPSYAYNKTTERKFKLVKNGAWIADYDTLGSVFP